MAAEKNAPGALCSFSFSLFIQNFTHAEKRRKKLNNSQGVLDAECGTSLKFKKKMHTGQGEKRSRVEKETFCHRRGCKESSKQATIPHNCGASILTPSAACLAARPGLPRHRSHPRVPALAPIFTWPAAACHRWLLVRSRAATRF